MISGYYFMDKNDLKIVFMGTPEFAVESLRVLVENDYQVVGVVTTPDKPVGRHGSMLCASPVKEYALSKGLPVLQPEKLKDEVFLSELRALQADLQIVVAFRILPEVVWDMPRFGTFNLHASLLPQYRGAAPINWAIIHGEKETGVTTFFLTHGVDTGRIIRQHKIPIAETDNAGIIHDKLMVSGAQLVLETVDLLIQHEGLVETIPQENLIRYDSELRPAPKLFKDNCRINWQQPAKSVYDFIRGLSPYPAAWTEIELPDGTIQSLKIYETELVPKTHNLPVGIIVSDLKYYLNIAVKDGFIRLLSMQLAGKKRLYTKDFLNGIKTLPEKVN
jgi:methionyl-tRNA formyltransferase